MTAAWVAPIALGCLTERAAVVAALRKWPPIGPSIARIERGEHRG